MPGGALPRVDERTLLPGTLPPLPGAVGEQRGDPPAAVRRVDHVVNFAMGRHVDPAPALVRRGDHRLVCALALLRVLDRLELASHAEPDGTLQPHPTELRGRPADAEQAGLEPPAGHRLRPEAVSLTQHDR